MKAISNAFKGVTYHNPQLGESLYELCRRATSRHISGPDEILSQQVVYMINSEMHTPYAAKDASTCLKRRLQMDHPQKQYLAIILTSKVLQECHAALGIYQGELLQEIAYILRTQRSSGPAAARTRQVAMDVLRHFGSAGGDAYRNVRQQGGMPVGPQHTVAATQNRDPAAVAAERESLLDEIKRMVEQASASTEILNELILNKRESQSADGQDDSAGLRRELLADAKELRKLFDMYMSQLAALTGSDAEQAMKSALEAVDQLDNAITLEKDVDAELKDLEAKGQLPAQASAEQPAPAAAAGAGTSAAAAADGAAAAAKMQSMNLIDLDDEPAPAAAAAPPPAAAPLDPFAPAAFGNPAPAAAAAAPADPFAPIAAAGSSDPFAPAAAAPAAALGGPVDPFAALAAAPTSAGFTVANGPAAAGDAGFGGMSQPFAQYPDPAAQLPPSSGPAAVAADPFVDTTPAWAAAPAAAAAEPAAAGSAGGAAAAPVTTGFDALAAAGPGGSSSIPQQQQQQPVTGLPSVSSGPASLGGVSAGTGGGMSAGGFMPQQQQMQQPGYGTPYGGPTGMGGYGMPYAQMMAPQMTGYGMSPYGGMTGQMPGGYYMPQQTGMQGMPGSSPYPSPYPGGPAAAASPYAAQTTGVNPYSQPAATAAPAAATPYSMSSGPASTGAYPSLPQQQTATPTPTSQPEPQQQQQLLQPQQQSYAAAAAAPAGGFGLSASNPFATVAPAAGSTANPFGAVAAGATGNVDAEWDKFFKQ